MAQTRIKICGVRDVETARVAADAGAQFFGLVFAERSPRQVTVDDANRIIEGVAGKGGEAACQPVALFADQSIDCIARTLSDLATQPIVQLHGHEDRAFVDAVADLGVSVFKAAPCDVRRIDAWRDAPACVRALLIDTPPNPCDLTGGTGRAFDWSVLKGLDRAGLPPIMLAGGLTPANVADAVRAVGPWAVDVSSGVESSRGVKDHAKIRAFCDAVRAVDQGMGA